MRKAGVKRVVAAVLVGILMISDTVFASDDYQVQTKNTVVDAADAHVIVQDTAGKYGLIDQDGE